VPKLGAKPGIAALRIDTVAKYDRSIEEVDPPKLARELVRVTHSDGVIWVVVWKNGRA
jgi:hypothetical protein